jgi:hypothetical protein
VPSQPDDKLFDDIARSDSSVARFSESTFDWLNRVDGDDCARVREVLESWYVDYPADSKADLRMRFRNRDMGQHVGAFWELYVFTLYRRLGHAVTVHPSVPGTDRKPDFLVSRDGTSMYVECAVVFPGDTAGRLTPGVEGYIYDYINTLSSPDFFVGLRFSQVGTQQPKVTEITKPLDEWLSSLNPDKELEAIDSGNDPPTKEISVRDWKLVYTPYPKSPDKRGEGRRLLGVLPPSGTFVVNDVEQLRDTLKRKGRRYGKSPDKPLVIAILNRSAFGGQDDLTDAVFGSITVEDGNGLSAPRLVRGRNGYWRGAEGGARVSGVLFGQNLNPWSVATVLPQLWINPWGSMPLVATDSLATFSVGDTGEIVAAGGGIEAHEVFGLPQGWPHDS